MQSSVLAIDDRKIAYLEVGDVQTAVKTVVFVHGWLDNAASFQKQLELVAQQYPTWRAIAIDLSGHGHSSHKSPHHFYNFHDYIDDLHLILNKLHAINVCLVGHSLGALITSCYSAAFPELISGLVQIEGHFPLAEPASLCVKRMRDGVLSRKRWRAKPQRALESKQHALSLRASANDLPEGLIEPIVQRGGYMQGERWHWHHDSKLKCDSIYRMTLEQSASIMAAIEVPHLVIFGEQGYPELQSPRYLKALNGSTIEFVAGGHHCHLESPSRVFELISGLVNKI
jgi:pimeloyl-ACP methyl ester carboxylesterase